MKKIILNTAFSFLAAYAAAAFFYLASKQPTGADLFGCLIFGSITAGLAIRRAKMVISRIASAALAESEKVARRIMARRAAIDELAEERESIRTSEKNFVFSEK